MQERHDYESVAAMLDSLGTGASQESEAIDLSDVFSDTLKVKTVAYADIANRLEGRTEQQGSEAVHEEAAPAPQRAEARAEMPRLAVNTEMRGAAGALRSMVGGIGRELEEGIKREEEKRAEKGLVMPKLSVQDQISDLEKINEGLQESVFNGEQKGIIAQEVRWLSSAAARGNLSGLNDYMRELVLIRDQKVKEIKGRLHIG